MEAYGGDIIKRVECNLYLKSFPALPHLQSIFSPIPEIVNCILGVDHLIFDEGVVEIPQKYRACASG